MGAIRLIEGREYISLEDKTKSYKIDRLTKTEVEYTIVKLQETPSGRAVNILGTSHIASIADFQQRVGT